MAVKTLTGFKRLVIIMVALLGFLVVKNWAARAGTSNPVLPDRKQQNQYAVVVAQNETQTSPKEKTAGSHESQESESKTDEKQESTGDKKKPLKDFHPSEKIEAEQAVDFPYDI